MCWKTSDLHLTQYTIVMISLFSCLYILSCGIKLVHFYVYLHVYVLVGISHHHPLLLMTMSHCLRFRLSTGVPEFSVMYQYKSSAALSIQCLILYLYS